MPRKPRVLAACMWALGAASLARADDNAERGAAIAASRTRGLCVLCHALPGVAASQSGTIGPSLAGVGARLQPGALRERVITPERFNADTVMPSYGRREGLSRVPSARRGRPLLEPHEIDDVVAYLASLR